MRQVTLTLNGRCYRLSCGEGEEARLQALIAHVRAKYDALFAEHGPVGDDRLFLMSALLIADELFDLRAANEAAADEAMTDGSRAEGAAATSDAAGPAAA